MAGKKRGQKMSFGRGRANSRIAAGQSASCGKQTRLSRHQQPREGRLAHRPLPCIAGHFPPPPPPTSRQNRPGDLAPGSLRATLGRSRSRGESRIGAAANATDSARARHQKSIPPLAAASQA